MTTEDETQALTGQILCMPWVKKFRLKPLVFDEFAVFDTWWADVHGKEYGEALEELRGLSHRNSWNPEPIPPDNRLALLKMAVATLGKLQEAPIRPAAFTMDAPR